MTVVTPTVRRNVDLPDIFEPVISTPRAGRQRDRCSPRRPQRGDGGHRVKTAGAPGGSKPRCGPIVSAGPDRGDADGGVDFADGPDDAEEFGSPGARSSSVTEVDAVGVEEKQLDSNIRIRAITTSLSRRATVPALQRQHERIRR